MKKKVAKLVLWSPMTRVIVDEDATYDEIVEAAREKFLDKIKYEYLENIEDVIDDLEVPYDPNTDGEGKVFIKCTVPTAYQESSIRMFGLPTKRSLDGSISIESEFDSVGEARLHLVDRAAIIAETAEEFEKLVEGINHCGVLPYDAAIAYIETKVK